MGELSYVRQEEEKMNTAGIRGKNRRMLDLLTASTSDKLLFYTRFLNEDEPLQTCLRRFQKHKIEQLNVTFGEFSLKLFNNDKEALELLFQEPVDNDVLEKIRDRFSDGTYTAQSMYEKFKENEGISVLRFTQKQRGFR